MKKILIIGAGFLQDFVIQKAKKMGYTVFAVDANPQAVGFANADEYAVINIVDKEACLAYAKEKEIDGVLTAATDYGVLTASYIAEQMNLPGLRYEIAQKIKNKYLIRKCLFENNVDDTEQAYEIDNKVSILEIKNKLKYPVMVKPCDGSGSRGASRVDTPEQLEAACQLAMESSITHKAEIETFIFGREYGAESIVINGEVHVLAIMQKWMTHPPFYAELGHAIPSELPPHIEENAKKCVADAIKALGINFGSVNMDMLVTPEGKIHIVDVGARMGGNMIGPCIVPYGTGIDYMANMIANAVGDKTDLSPAQSSAVATRLLAFDRNGIIKELPDFNKLEKEFNVEIYHHMTVGQQVNRYQTNLDGCGYIIAKSINIKESINKTNSVLDNIKNIIFV